jgi:rhodanese-related sulfurtransferase
VRDLPFWIGAALFAFFVVRFVVAARNRIAGPAAREKVSAGALLLDVRSEGEFRGGAIPGAKNIPVQSLASRIAELDPARAVVVYCASGVRSASAASLLKRRGFREVHDLGPAAAW